VIRSVPDAVWEKTRNPLITFTDTDYMTTLMAPSKSEQNEIAGGLYWAGDGVIDSKGWTLADGGESNQIWLHDTKHSARIVQHNLMHELGHSVWYHDVYDPGSDEYRQIENSLKHILVANEPPDPLGKDASGDMWHYPRTTYRAASETFSELHAYMSFEPTRWGAKAQTHIAAEREHPSYDPLNMFDWMNDHYDGEMPTVNEVVVSKKDEIGFQGECGTDDVERKINRKSDLKRKKIIKHLPGQHDQKKHGRKGSRKPAPFEVVGGSSATPREKTFGDLKVQEAIEHQAAMEVTAKEIYRAIPSDERSGIMKLGVDGPYKYDNFNFEYGGHSERYGSFKALHEVTESDELREMIEFEGLDVEEEHEFWKRHSIRSVLKKSVSPVHVAASLDKVKAFLDDSQIYMRVDEWSLNEIVQSGEILTQDATGTSNGMYNPDKRALVHNILFGYEEGHHDAYESELGGTSWGDTPDSYRVPLYGYVAQNPWTGGAVEGYGDIALEIDNNLKGSTTVSLGDSLDDSGVGRSIRGGGLFDPMGDLRISGISGSTPDFAPTPVTDPGIEVLNGLVSERVTLLSAPTKSLPVWLNNVGEHYVEAQIHKPLDIYSDITAAHVRIGPISTVFAAADENPAAWNLINAGVPVNVWRGGLKIAVLDEIDDDNEIVFPEGIPDPS